MDPNPQLTQRWEEQKQNVGVSKNNGTPKSSILRFSIINHLFWGTSIFGHIHVKPVFFGGNKATQS